MGLSICLIAPPPRRAAGLLLRPRGQAVSTDCFTARSKRGRFSMHIHSSTAVSSKCEQCRLYIGSLYFFTLMLRRPTNKWERRHYVFIWTVTKIGPIN